MKLWNRVVKYTRFHVDTLHPPVLGEQSLQVWLTSIVLEITTEQWPHLHNSAPKTPSIQIIEKTQLIYFHINFEEIFLYCTNSFASNTNYLKAKSSISMFGRWERRKDYSFIYYKGVKPTKTQVISFGEPDSRNRSFLQLSFVFLGNQIDDEGLG